MSVVANSAALAHTHSFVIDAEVVAYDRAQESLLPFQILSTRKRKAETTEGITVQVQFVVYVIHRGKYIYVYKFNIVCMFESALLLLC